MRLQANYSGAGQVTTLRSKDPTIAGYMENLNKVFVREVIENLKFAWYVDHFTEDVQMFNVRHLAVDPLLSWTNEALNQRDPNDPMNGQWGQDDVATWFTDGEGGSHAYVVKFLAGGIEHKLTLRPYSATLNDIGEVWNEYVDQGVRGALGRYLEQFESLIAIEHYTL